MTADRVHEYWLAITCLEAQELLQAFKIMDWPQMKEAKRATLHRSIWKAAWPESMRVKNYITPEEAMRKYNGK